jgi:hypothetical protein
MGHASELVVGVDTVAADEGIEALYDAKNAAPCNHARVACLVVTQMSLGPIGRFRA